jgi:hypothetical protein
MSALLVSSAIDYKYGVGGLEITDDLAFRLWKFGVMKQSIPALLHLVHGAE